MQHFWAVGRATPHDLTKTSCLNMEAANIVSQFALRKQVNDSRVDDLYMSLLMCLNVNNIKLLIKTIVNDTCSPYCLALNSQLHQLCFDIIN